MAKILQLDAHVADLIAAGEVVERPASVVKELMENALDAGATAITVEVRDGGMTYIRITDNGCGIAPEDTETAFLRHATSKLRDEKGLEAISTLGFRGEALAAIAAVSRIELLTRETGAQAGTSLALEGGTVVSRELAGCPEGTTMIVRNLFYNTPARLKFMKSDKAEGAGISAQVLAVALSHPEVSFRYLRDGKEEYHTPGDGRVDSCVYSLFGREFAGGLLKAVSGDRGVTVSGFVSTPASARGNRSCQYFFVNGRTVKSKTLQAALEQAYRNTLFTGRFPSCILYLTTSTAAVDVNVHPTKTEVKFLNEHDVFDGIYYAALAALEGEAKPAVFPVSESTRRLVTPTPPTPTPASASAQSPARTPETAPARPLSAPVLDPAPAPKPGAGAAGSSYGGGFGRPVQPEKAAAFRETSTYAPIRDTTAAPYRTYAAQPVQINLPEAEPESPPPAEISDMPVPKHSRIVGEALDTYIIVEQGDSLWLIDKHAAHERIHFDRLKNEKQVTMSQTLLVPIVCDFGGEDAALLLENSSLLEALGFHVDPFGEASLAVRELPSAIDAGETESLLSEMARILRRGGRPDEGTVLDTLRQSVACKAAIKAGSKSEPQELISLVDRVLSGEIRYCPHGRPVAFELTKAALDRNFKRT